MNAVTQMIPGFEEFEKFEEQRVTALCRMLEILSKFRPGGEHAAFSSLFSHAQKLLEMDDTELSEKLRVSRPTVGRWARGESSPHPLAQEAVVKTFADFVMQRLKRHPEATRSLAGAKD